MNKPLPPPRFKQIRPPNDNYTYFEDHLHHKFIPDASSFELVNAAWLADFAMLAYGNEAFIHTKLMESELIAEGFVMQFISRKTTQCFIVSNNEFVVLSFRGTEIDNFWGAFKDWMRFFELEPVTDGTDGKVHKGFLKDITEVWPYVQPVLEFLLRGTKRTLWITGHSLGAALATLGAVRAVRDAGFNVQGVYNYGAPRVGDTAHARKYADRGLAAKTFRFVYDVDIAPAKLPPGDVYQHLGQEKFIDKNGQLHDRVPVAPADELRKALKELAAIERRGETLMTDARGFRIPPRFADHAPIYYASHIWNALP